MARAQAMSARRTISRCPFRRPAGPAAPKKIAKLRNTKQMMLAHSKADLHEESLGYWRLLVCLDGVGQVAIDPSTCESALKSAVVINQWDEVEAIADMLKVRARNAVISLFV